MDSNLFIPLDFLTGDRNQRLELMAGIMDTTCANVDRINGIYEVSLANEHLTRNFIQLAYSLGFNVTQNQNKIFISGKITDIPFKVNYYKCDINSPSKLLKFSVRKIKHIKYYGFMCDGDHRYMLWNHILTHNTWVLLKCALAAAQQGLAVGIYSGEMSERKVGYRIDTLLSHIPNGKIIHGDSSIQNEYKKYLDNLSNSIPGSLKILTPNMIGGPAGVSALRAFIEREKLDALYIDQHSLLEDDRKAKNPVEKAANISKDLKNLQVLKQIPIIAVSQQNRSSVDEGPGTSNVAQSDRIAQDSTIIWFLEQKNGILTITLGKVRDANAGSKYQYAIDLNRGNFTYIPSENDNNENTDECDKLRDKYEPNMEYMSDGESGVFNN